MRSKFLKLLAVLSFGLVTFPFVLTNDVLAFEGISPLRILCYYCGFGAVFLIGYGFASVSYRKKALTVLMRVTGFLTFGTGFVLLIWAKEINIIFAVGASAVLWYFLGVRANRKHYADIFPAFMFGIYIVVTLISYLFYGTMCEKELKEPIQTAVITAFMIELCLAALLINQSNIYDRANRRRETRTMLPKGLSGFNAALVLGVTAGGLCLYAFADDIVGVLNALVRFLIRVALFIIRGSSEFMAIESGDGALSGDGYIQPNTYDGWNVLFIIILLIFAVRFRKQIFKALKNFFGRIFGFFAKETELSFPEPEFTDVFENISSSRGRNRDLSYSGLMRSYKGENDPVKKYRCGYRILLKQLCLCKADIKGADTVTVQHEKGRELCGSGLKAVTECYNELRYNNASVTTEQLSALDKLINDMNVLLKGRI